MKRLIFGAFFAVATFGLLVLAFGWPSVHAATLARTQEGCHNVAVLAANVATYRDAGLPWEMIQDRLNASLEEARQHRDQAWVKDADDDQLAVSAAKHAYDSDLEPGEVMAETYTACLGIK